MKTEVMGKEPAENEFDRLCELWDVDNDTSWMNAEDAESLQDLKQVFVKWFMGGRVSLNDEGHLNVSLKFSKNFGKDSVVVDPDRADMLAMDGFGPKEGQHKVRAYAASMTGLSHGEYAKINPRDDKILLKVVALFLA